MVMKSLKKTVAAASAATIAAVSMAGSFASAAGSEYLDYASALQYSLYIFDANMCGTDVGEKSALSWRDDCHKNDIFDWNGQQIDLTGGYHDAGDHVKFGLPAAFTASTLEMAYYEFGEAFTQTKQDAHLKTVLDRFADYFKKCAVYGEDGKIAAFAYQVGTGGGQGDHGYWGPPELQPDDYTTQEGGVGRRDAYFTSAENPCSDIVSGTAAALAAHYVNYGDAESLKVAKDLAEYVRENEKKVSNVPQYSRWESSSDPNTPTDYIALCGLWLNKATGTADYDDLVGLMGSIGKQYTNWPHNWDGVWPAVNVLKGNWGIVKSNNSQYNSGDGYRFVMEWGSARLNASLQFIGMIYDKHNPSNNNAYYEWAKNQMDILFGKNDINTAFMVGYNYRDDITYPQFPHHRASDGGTVSPDEWNISAHEPIVTRPQQNVLVGALVGGPETSDFGYYDSLNNYVGNEVALDYSAAFVGALAALYLQYGENDSIVEPPSSIAPGVKDMYSTNSPGTPVTTTTATSGTGTGTVATTTTTAVTTTADTSPETSDGNIKMTILAIACGFTAGAVVVFLIKKKKVN